MLRIVLVIFIFIAFQAIGQDFRIPYRKGNLWGYADQTGKIIVEPRYDTVDVRAENRRWLVMKNDMIGVIDELGNEILPVEFDSVFRKPVRSGLNEFYVYKNGKVGYFDMLGKELLPVEYQALQKCSNLFSKNPLNFFARKKANTNWTIVDHTEKSYLDGIEEFVNLQDGIYFLKVKSGWGIYDVLNKQWKIEADFDSIEYFDNEDGKVPMQEYLPYKYFAVKGNTSTLIAENFETATFKNTTKADFMSDEPLYSGDLYVEEAVADVKHLELISVTNLEFNSKAKYNLLNSRLTKKSFVQMKVENRSYIITINSPEGVRVLSMKFDKVKLISIGISTFDNRVAIVCLKGKWGVYSLEHDKLIVPFEYEEPILSDQFRDIIILPKKGKIGVYCISKELNQPSEVIEPKFDGLADVREIANYTQGYSRFMVYYLMKNGKACPIGYNGVNFFED